MSVKKQYRASLLMLMAVFVCGLQEVPLFSADGSVFYLTLPAKQGARGEFRHIASLSSQVSGARMRHYVDMHEL